MYAINAFPFAHTPLCVARKCKKKGLITYIHSSLDVGWARTLSVDPLVSWLEGTSRATRVLLSSPLLSCFPFTCSVLHTSLFYGSSGQEFACTCSAPQKKKAEVGMPLRPCRLPPSSALHSVFSKPAFGALFTPPFPTQLAAVATGSPSTR